MSELTPMMKQYFEIKNNYPDCIVFYRLGDFYEMFFDDAIIASKELELTLTDRDCGQEEKAPMCGVPYHASSVYIARLIAKDFKVAICEQVEDPSVAKGLVKREVVRVITPGTLLESNILDEKSNNFLVSIYFDESARGLTYTDISTGMLKTTQFCYGNINDKLVDELTRLDPAEIIINNNDTQDLERFLKLLKTKISAHITYIDHSKDLLKAHNNLKDKLGDHIILDPQYELCMLSTDMLLNYLIETQKNKLDNLNFINYYSIEEYMILDSSTRKNLELTETIRDRKKR